MPTARQIITGALTTRLNRLSPGETLDDDLAASCLAALNDISDEWSAGQAFLWRTALHPAVVTGASASLGVAWTGLASGHAILGATYASGGTDQPICPVTMAQYHEQVGSKSSTGSPEVFAHDGAATVYFYPAPVALTITLRARQSVATFADLATDYEMPEGYRSALADVLAERVAPFVLGGLPADVARFAASARRRIAARSADPAMLGGNIAGRHGNILQGWR